MSKESKVTGAPAENLAVHVEQAEKDFEPTEEVKQKSQHQRLNLFESMHAVLKEKGDQVTEATPERYAEMILEHMAGSDHNYQIVAFEILKHTLAIPYEEKSERLEKYLKDIKDFKEAAEKMKKGFGFVSFGKEGEQKKRVVKLIKILKETVAYLEKMKKLSDEEKAGFEEPEEGKKLSDSENADFEKPKEKKELTRRQKTLLKMKKDLRGELMKLEKDLEVKRKEQDKKKAAKIEGVGENVVDFAVAKKEKEAAAAKVSAATLKPEEEKKHEEAVEAEVVTEGKSANG